MVPASVRFVLETMAKRQVRCLLMGGQACVIHGAAEFSKDIDFVVPLDEKNLDCMRLALQDLKAEVIAIPPFESRFLADGLAVHFRSKHPRSNGLWIDIMTQMRNVDSFDRLWDRRETIDTPRGPIDFLGVWDLIRAKKTQRSKDWPMIE